MHTLDQIIADAQKNHIAIGHFNVATIDMVWGLVQAMKRMKETHGFMPTVIAGASEGERDFLGVTQFPQLITHIREEQQIPLFSNADHTYSIERTKEAIDAGFDMVVFDGAELSYDENVSQTHACVTYRDTQNAHTLVEAEFGFIGSGSSLKDEVPEGVSEETMTNPEEARQFIASTHVDLLAPSVGNVHGIIKKGHPALAHERIAAVAEAAGVPLVLHGGSGSSNEEFQAAITAGITIIHISTELRVAYKKGVEAGISSNELAPYRYLADAQKQYSDAVFAYLELFTKVRT